MAKTKRVYLGHNLFRDEPMAFDARPRKAARDRDDDRDDGDLYDDYNTGPARDDDPDDERDFEHFLGSVLSDALRAWKARGTDGASRELGQSDRRRARDAELPDHRQDFDPTPMTEREREYARARDRRRATADSRLGFDDKRVRAAIKKADLLSELDELFGLKGNG